MTFESSVLENCAAGEPGDWDRQSRILAEFEEMPGLNLTLRQASRLFGLDASTCERVLVQLVTSGALGVVDGLFVLRENDTDDDSC